MTSAWRFGPRLEPAGGTTFRLWAPAAHMVELLIGERALPMQPREPGWFALHDAAAVPGARYRFRIDHEIEVPDPASAFQPEDALGPSEVIDHGFAWQCPDWKGRPWHEAVVLELHVGALTQAGTFRAVAERLDQIAATGVTAIQLMPVADFAGRWNWGYDGVLWFAPDSSYGRPEQLRALVDAAHQRGLMMLLDVIYNHFGPEGNFLPRYAPAFFTDRHRTPWGDAIDYRVPEVRAFAIENALRWLDHYRFDGLRLDAVHAIAEPGEPHILHELSRAVGEFAAATGSHIHLVLENDDNRASLLDPTSPVPRGKYRAQWNDDYHHAWHVLLTGEQAGYYRDYAAAPAKALGCALVSGFVYQGEPSEHRDGARRGEPTNELPLTAFVNFLQNHDQIGNRRHGDRLTVLAQPEALEAALAITLLAPSPPLLFMGEEWGATEPFPFFCDFRGALAEAVRHGRISAVVDADAPAERTRPPPDPLAETTFRQATLDWSQREREPFAARLDLVRKLLVLRRRYVVPWLAREGLVNIECALRDGVLRVLWHKEGAGTLSLLANLGGDESFNGLPSPAAAWIWGGAPPIRLPAWSVYWWLGPG
jgi:maltooligosyltrehalose trehalohydrolase